MTDPVFKVPPLLNFKFPTLISFQFSSKYQTPILQIRTVSAQSVQIKSHFKLHAILIFPHHSSLGIQNMTGLCTLHSSARLQQTNGTIQRSVPVYYEKVWCPAVMFHGKGGDQLMFTTTENPFVMQFVKRTSTLRKSEEGIVPMAAMI